MAKHEVIIRENTGTTKTDAPYLPNYIKKSNLDFADICSQVAVEAGLTDTQSRAIFEGAFAEFEKLEKDAPVRIHVDGLTVTMVIYGSFATSDAAFDPLKNTLALALYLEDDIKYALADVTPTIVTDETATKVRITLVADEAVPRPYEVIHGQHVFEVQGVNIETGDEGGGISLENGIGTSFPCAVVETVSKQKTRAKSVNLLEGGDYKLCVKSRGGDPEGPLQTVYRKVKYLKIFDPPTVTGFTDTRYDGGLGWTDSWKVAGSALFDQAHAPTGATYVSAAKLLHTPTGGTEAEVAGVTPVFAADGTGITFDTSAVAAAVRVAGTARVQLTCTNGTTESTIYTDAKATKPLICGNAAGSTKVFGINAAPGTQLNVPFEVQLEGFGLDQGGEGVAGVTDTYLEATEGGRDAFWVNETYQTGGKALKIQIDPAEGTAPGDKGTGYLGLDTVDAEGATESLSINYAKIMVSE